MSKYSPGFKNILEEGDEEEEPVSKSPDLRNWNEK